MSSADNSPERPVPVRNVAPDPAPEEQWDETGSAEQERLQGPILPDGKWLVRSGGRTRSGTGLDSGAPLVLVFFHKRDPESGVVEEEPDREAWAVGRDPERWDPARLEDLLRKSRPFRPLPEPPPSTPTPPPPSPIRRSSTRRPRRLD